MIILIKKISLKVCSYFQNQFQLNELEVIKFDYSLTVIINELSKFLIMLLFFALFNQVKLFLYIILALTSIRSYTGGLHFNTYLSCLTFSLIFFIFTAVSSLFIVLNTFVLTSIITFILIVLIFVPPIPAKSRSNYSKRKLLYFKTVSIVIFLIHLAFCYLFKNNLYLTTALWVYLYQSVQLIIAKGWYSYEKGRMLVKSP